MRRRIRSLFRPEDAEQPPSARASEAVALWLTGVLWMGVCIAVARLNLIALLPAVLTGGLVMAWGGRRLTNYLWFPLAATAAVLVEPLASADPGWHAPLLTHLDLVVLAVVVLVPMRVVMRRRYRIPFLVRPPSVRLVVVGVALVGLQVVGANDLAAGLHSGGRTLAAFAVSFVICSRPQRAAGLWNAVALLSATLLGGALLAAAHGGVPAVVAFVVRVDQSWHGPHTLLTTLLFAAPVTLGYALDRPRHAVRWGLAVVALGAFAMAGTLVMTGGGWWSLREGTSVADVLRFMAIGALLVAGVAGALRVGSARPAERGTWTGLALAFAALALGSTAGIGLTSTPVVFFGAAAAGAVVSALDRAERRREGLVRVLTDRPGGWPTVDEELEQAA
jgi:hypothetical protein